MGEKAILRENPDYNFYFVFFADLEKCRLDRYDIWIGNGYLMTKHIPWITYK
jgi:hypothetical protein